MEFILRQVHKAGIFGWLYGMALLHAFHFFAIHFLDSSFLGQYLGKTEVGLIFSATSFLSLIVLSSVSIFLTRFGNFKTALFATTLNFIASIGIAFVTDIGILFVLYALHAVAVPVTIYCFDVFLKNYSKNENSTGSMRGLFLSMSFIASLFAPVITGYVVGEPAIYANAYLVSALYLVPVIVLLLTEFSSFKDPTYHILSFFGILQAIRENRNIFYISIGQFLLRFFFSLMVVFMPIYLHENIGFTWLEIGIIFFTMLVPFLLIEYPAGVIADRWLGEKELLVAGFLITGFSTAYLFFIDSSSVLVWSVALFATRVGAALIESMTEAYFFKQIDGGEASILSLFHMLRPFAYTVGPLVGSVLLLIISIEFLWPILGGCMLLGIFGALALEDTR